MVATLQQQPLGQLLVNRGLLEQKQVDQALTEQKQWGPRRQLLGEILIEQKACSAEQVSEALAEAYGVPFARLGPRLADPKVVSLLPREFLDQHNVLPLFLVEGVLTVALAEVVDVFLLEEIARMTGKVVQAVAATASDIRATLDAYLPGERVFVVEELVAEGGELTFAPPANVLSGPAADPAAVRLVDSLLYHAVKEGASDIHLEPGDDDLRIRCRIDGSLVEKTRTPKRMAGAVGDRLRQLAGLAPPAARLASEGLIRLTADGRAVELKVSFVPGRHGQTIVIHLSDARQGPLKLEKLGFGYDALKSWRKVLALPAGLVLVSGPAGSGKRTTLYSALAARVGPDVNLCSVEDPIEQSVPGVNQYQIDEPAGFTFDEAIRALARQDVDVLMIGDVRDAQTAKQAAQAALMGRLVFAGVVTPDAPSAVARLMHLGVEPYILGSTLAGVLAQRLVRKLCANCKESAEPAAADRRSFQKLGGIDHLFHPKGCPRCRQVGYSGRTGIHELWAPDDAALDRITQGADLAALRELARRGGLKSLRIDGLEKVKSGITTLEEVHRVTGT